MIMVTRVQKWGNGVALRIPKSLADEKKNLHGEVNTGPARGREAW